METSAADNFHATIEEDPNSRFVDYSNATDFEAFVNDLENVLHSWGFTDASVIPRFINPSSNQSSADSSGKNISLQQEVKWAATSVYKLSFVTTSFNSKLPTHEIEAATSLLARSNGESRGGWNECNQHFTPTMLSMGNPEFDFQSEDSLPWRWFGIRHYFLLSRVQDASDLLGNVDVNEASLLLSAIRVALSHCNCTLPALVPVYEPSRKSYIGCCVPGSDGNVTIHFETDAVPELSTNQSCVSGLLDFFRLKLHLPPRFQDDRIQSVDITASVCFSVDFACFDNNSSSGLMESFDVTLEWRKARKPMDEKSDTSMVGKAIAVPEEDAIDTLDASASRTFCSEGSKFLPVAASPERVMKTLCGNSAYPLWGPLKNPLRCVRVQFIWPSLKEGSYVDNAVHSTLDPNLAPVLRLRPIWEVMNSVEDTPLAAMLHRLLINFEQAKEWTRELLVTEWTSSSSPFSTSFSSSRLASALASISVSSFESTNLPPRLVSTIPHALGTALGSMTQRLVQMAAATLSQRSSYGKATEEIMRELFIYPKEDAKKKGEAKQTNASSRCFTPSSSSLFHTSPTMKNKERASVMSAGHLRNEENTAAKAPAEWNAPDSFTNPCKSSTDRWISATKIEEDKSHFCVGPSDVHAPVAGAGAASDGVADCVGVGTAAPGAAGAGDSDLDDVDGDIEWSSKRAARLRRRRSHGYSMDQERVETVEDTEKKKKEEAEGEGEKEGKERKGNEKSASFHSIPSCLQHACPVGEMVSLLALRMADLSDMEAMAMLWLEFVKELRRLSENAQMIPRMNCPLDLSPEHDIVSQVPLPDSQQCILHQKLQMLNCCIARQKCNDPKNGATGINVKTPQEKDLYFDAAANKQKDDAEQEESSECDDDEMFFDSAESMQTQTYPPEGVKSPWSSPDPFSLFSKAQLNIPETQERLPMTEDMIHEQEAILFQLGDSPEASHLRRQLLGAPLLSDMQAFKAANPGCVFADFVRWASPVDWLSWTALTTEETEYLREERRRCNLQGQATQAQGLTIEVEDFDRDGTEWFWEGQGVLSKRMREMTGMTGTKEGKVEVEVGEASQEEPVFHGRTRVAGERRNKTGELPMTSWPSTWRRAQPLPKQRQRPLFDIHQEMEKVFHFLETRHPTFVFYQMLVALIASVDHVFTHASTSATELSAIQTLLHAMRCRAQHAIQALDETYEMESNFSSSLISATSKEERTMAENHLKVSYAMTIEVVKKLVEDVADVEMALSHATSLLHVLPGEMELVNGILWCRGLSYQVSCPQTKERILRNLRVNNHLVKHPSSSSSSTEDDRGGILKEGVENNDPTLLPIVPNRREYILRCISPRPFHLPEYAHATSETVLSRMYASFDNQTVRFALSMADSDF